MHQILKINRIFIHKKRNKTQKEPCIFPKYSKEAQVRYLCHQDADSDKKICCCFFERSQEGRGGAEIIEDFEVVDGEEAVFSFYFSLPPSRLVLFHHKHIITHFEGQLRLRFLLIIESRYAHCYDVTLRFLFIPPPPSSPSRTPSRPVCYYYYFTDAKDGISGNDVRVEFV